MLVPIMSNILLKVHVPILTRYAKFESETSFCSATIPYRFLAALPNLKPNPIHVVPHYEKCTANDKCSHTNSPVESESAASFCKVLHKEHVPIQTLSAKSKSAASFYRDAFSGFLSDFNQFSSCYIRPTENLKKGGISNQIKNMASCPPQQAPGLPP